LAGFHEEIFSHCVKCIILNYLDFHSKNGGPVENPTSDDEVHLSEIDTEIEDEMVVKGRVVKLRIGPCPQN